MWRLFSICAESQRKSIFWGTFRGWGRPCCNPDWNDAGNPAFAARARADDIASRTQHVGLAAPIIKALIEAQGRAFLRQEHSPVLAVLHGQLDAGVTEELGAGNAIDTDTGLAALTRRLRARGEGLAGLDTHAFPRGEDIDRRFGFRRRRGLARRSASQERCHGQQTEWPDYLLQCLHVRPIGPFCPPDAPWCGCTGAVER
jgi:hypothetical protein